MAEIQLEKTALGLELGSTRIKAVLIGPEHAVLASGAHDWENRLEHGYWTYALDDVWAGVQDAFARLARQVQERYGTPLHTVGAMGVSGMMHGYLPFARDGAQLAAFRTWRNTTTERAAALLTERFAFNVPQRWSVAHLYQAILDGEPHARDIAYLTTLAGYVHWRLTGERVLGVGEASGMFPIDSAACGYDAGMEKTFDALLAQEGMPYRLADILPRVLCAGADAGTLTAEGACLLDPTGVLRPGGGRGHGHGRHQQRGRAHGQCFGGHQRVCHGGAGTPARQGVSGDRYGHHPHGATGGDGTLQHLHI